MMIMKNRRVMELLLRKVLVMDFPMNEFYLVHRQGAERFNLPTDSSLDQNEPVKSAKED
jgi:hypothetical protein